MRYRIPLILSLLLIFSAKIFAAVFVVTSNADSGPGTLRQALTLAAANGSAIKDSIIFNLADTSTTGRKITLVTQLPELSSNLVIDGTTQKGSAFGQGNARVEILTPLNNIQFTTLKGSDLNNVELYGLYIYDYSDIIISRPDLKQREGLNITNSINITIGAANKGNVIKGFNSHSVYLDSINFVNIKNNIIGLAADNSISGDNLTADVTLKSCNNINIGGNNNEGNILFCSLIIAFAENTSNNLSIKSNNFGVFQDGKTTTYQYQDDGSINIYTLHLNNYFGYRADSAKASIDKIDIESNLAGNFFNLFVLDALKGSINFYNNYFGIAKDGVTSLNTFKSHPNEGVAISITDCAAQIDIGSNDSSKSNFFANVIDGVVANGLDNIYIRNNEYECISYEAYNIFGLEGILPSVAISQVRTNNSQTTLTGSASPNAIIDIYSSESCLYAQCSIRKYLQTVIADNNGNWTSSNLNYSGVFYVSATVNNKTSEFKTFEINSQKVIVTNLRCDSTASITGLKVPSGLNYYWVNQKGKIVSQQLDLHTSETGTYQLILGDGCIKSNQYQIVNDMLLLDSSQVVKTDISCGQNNGSIKNLYVSDPLNELKSTQWYNAGGTVVATTINIENLGPGTYSFKAITADGCIQRYGPVILKNVSGPNIDQSNVVVQSTSCGQSTGSIANLNVTGTGTLKYIWWNRQQQTVGTDKDLFNQPAGIYKLQVTDDSQCGAVYSTNIEIPETNGIILDESVVITKAASCNSNNGSITGLQIGGATAYQWTDANSKLVGTSADLLNAAPGTYVLTATNSFGCSETSKSYQILQKPQTKFPAYNAVIISPCFKNVNGSVKVTTDTLVKSTRWVNAAGQNIGSGAELSNIGAGVYQLYLTDQNGCESYFNSYTVNELPELKAVSTGNVTNDQCTLSSGSIEGEDIEGGLPPYTYTWYNSNHQQIGNGTTINKLAAGAYSLNVTDTRCGNVDIPYQVIDQPEDIPAPDVSDVYLCSSGSALLSVHNATPSAIYRLYSDAGNSQPLDEQKGGKFKVHVVGNSSYYISQLNGSCESSRSKVDVEVGLSTLNIANAFTPNGDGINDYWEIAGIENYPNARVQVFARYGQKVFESRGYLSPFNGTWNGQSLPSGVYYYIINLQTNCNLINGSITIIR